MKVKSFFIGFGAFALSTALLYWLGSVFSIPWLELQYEYKNTEDEFFVSLGSIVPIILGLMVSYIAEKMYRLKIDKTLVN